MASTALAQRPRAPLRELRVPQCLTGRRERLLPARRDILRSHPGRSGSGTNLAPHTHDRCAFGPPARERNGDEGDHARQHSRTIAWPRTRSPDRRPGEPLRCRPYGGVVVKGAWVDGHCVVGGAGLLWLRFAGRPGRSRGSRRSVMLIFGGWVPQDLCSSHVRCLKSSAPARGAGAQATNRGVVCSEPGSLGPPRQPQRAVDFSVSW